MKMSLADRDEETDPPPAKRRKGNTWKGSSVLANAKATRGKTALHYAAARGHTKVCLKLSGETFVQIITAGDCTF